MSILHISNIIKAKKDSAKYILAIDRFMRKKLLYASPFLPMKTGISDYSEVLVYGLKKYFDISLLIDNYKLENKKLYKDFKVKVYTKDKIAYQIYDYIIYNIGNNPTYHTYIYDSILKYPGMIILHDFILYYLTIGYYRNKKNFYSKIYELSGVRGINILKQKIKNGEENLLECKDIANLLPLNKELLNSNSLIMVHSYYTYNKIKEIINNKNRLKKINHIELIDKGFPFINKDLLLNSYNIPKDSFLISSFGYIAPTKLNHIICEVVKKINSVINKKVYYFMVGEGFYVDQYIDNKYIFKTGYSNLREFNSFIMNSDLIINLRNPSMGETSGALIRALGVGKPCIVSNDAWFSELPDDVVVKINNQSAKEELYEKIIYLINNKTQFSNISIKAKKYISKYHSIDTISHDIYKFLECH